MGKYDELVDGLRKTAQVLRLQADLASRIADTYEPERERWGEAEKGDDRLTAMVRYQIEQEQLAKSLSKDAGEAEQAATAITALEAELAAMKARGDRLAEFAEHGSDCVLRIPKAIRSRSSVQEVCSCGKSQALTEWRDR